MCSLIVPTAFTLSSSGLLRLADYYNIYVGDSVIVCTQQDALGNGGVSITDALQGKVGQRCGVYRGLQQ